MSGSSTIIFCNDILTEANDDDDDDDEEEEEEEEEEGEEEEEEEEEEDDEEEQEKEKEGGEKKDGADGDIEEERGGGFSAPLALAGGGRYDDLIKMLGGKDTPAMGGAIGIDRVADLVGKTMNVNEEHSVRVFLVQLGMIAKRKLMKLREVFRKEKISVAESFGRDSIKAQLKIADRLQADFVLILGQREALDDTIILRDMKTGAQEIIPLPKIFDEIKKRLKK